MRDFIGGSVSILTGLIFLYSSLTSELPIFIQTGAPGPMFFPILLSLFLLLLGFYVTFKDLKSSGISFEGFKKDWIKEAKYPLIFILLSFLYIIFFPLIGCVISTAIYSFILQKVLRTRTNVAILTTALIIVLIFLLFIKTLRVVFPEPVIGYVLYSLLTFRIITGG